MDVAQLTSLNETLWLWVAAPVLALVGLLLSIRLAFPQVTRLIGGFRALNAHDADHEGDLHPAAATMLAALATYGAAATVGAATAVSLGGAGAVLWVWLFALLIAPLRVAETLLARTAPAGAPGTQTGSLTGRLLQGPDGWMRAFGWLLLVILPIVGFAFFGGVHGDAIHTAAETLLPGQGTIATYGIAGLAAVLVLLPSKKTATILGWLGVFSATALFGAGLIALIKDPGAAAGTLTRALTDLTRGAAQSRAFSGALAGEITLAAMLYLLPPLASTSGILGGLHGQARAESTKNQASAAMVGTVMYCVLCTVFGLAFISTGTFDSRTEGEIPFNDVVIYEVGFETASQRLENDRLYTGVMRFEEGGIGVVPLEFATARGMIRNPQVYFRGEPAEILLHITDGVPDALQAHGDLGAFQHRPLSELTDVTVRGEMLPSNSALVAAATQEGGGEYTRHAALTALLILGLLATIAWGLGLFAAWRSQITHPAGRAIALLPAAGLALAASGLLPTLPLWGMLAAGTSATLVAVVLALTSGLTAKLV